MANITVKNIPDELYERLRISARLHHRSINGEIIALIERHMVARHISVEELLSRVRHGRERLGDPWSPEEIDAAIGEGRA